MGTKRVNELMSRFLPKSARTIFPDCCDLAELFKTDAAVRMIKYLAKIHTDHSDGSSKRIFRAGVVTEQFFIGMPTVDAYIAEIELCNAVWSLEKNENSQNIKVYLQKYLDTHTFVYGENFKRVKAGRLSSWTGRNVQLYLLTGSTSRVLNAIQLWLVTRIEAELGINANYSISKL